MEAMQTDSASALKNCLPFLSEAWTAPSRLRDDKALPRRFHGKGLTIAAGLPSGEDFSLLLPLLLSAC